MKLAFSEVAGARPVRTAVILHGILGSGRNWRMFARRMADRWPAWRFMLPDLRNHGESHGGAPPHDLDACAADLVETFGEIDAMVGHSFGGKVTAAWARDHLRPGRAAWILDAIPGRPTGNPATSDHEIARVLAAVRAVPLPVATHESLARTLEAAGFTPALAGWMTTNLRRAPDGLTWRFDLTQIPAMLEAYWSTDAWPWIAGDPGEVHLVRAGASDRWGATELGDALNWAASWPKSRFFHTIPDAGHWVHVDAPDAVLGLLARTFEG